MSVRILLCAALVAGPAALRAQSSWLRAENVVLSAGVGTGSASFTCNACGSRRDEGVTGLLRAGVKVRSDIVVAVEGTGWFTDAKDSRGTAGERILIGDATVQWFPRWVTGLFVKGGVGVASIRDRIEISGLAPTNVSTLGPSFVVGAGWDFPVARAWRVSPYADFHIAPESDLSANGQRVSGQLSASLIHLGVAVTR